MNQFISNQNIIVKVLPRNEGRLFWTDEIIKKGFDLVGEDFKKKFVNNIVTKQSIYLMEEKTRVKE